MPLAAKGDRTTMVYDISIDWENQTFEMEGHEIKMQLRPLLNWAMLDLYPLLMDAKPRKEKETLLEYKARLTPEEVDAQGRNAIKVQQLAEKIFPDHVREITGLTVNEKPVEIKQLATESIFLELTCEICGRLAAITRLTKETEKNSNWESGLPNQENTLTSESPDSQ